MHYIVLRLWGKSAMAPSLEGKILRETNTLRFAHDLMALCAG